MIGKKLFMMAAVAGLAGALAIPSVAQNDWHHRDHDQYNNGNNSKAYQQGLHEGQEDRARGNQREHRHAWSNDNDAGAYAAGYRDGYGNAQANGAYNNGRYYGGNGGGHPYGNGGFAQNTGYQDGLNDGRNDRSTGHSFRPTHDDNYKNADRGYRSELGSKQNYKNTYRQGYEQGYQEGYNGGGRGYRR